MRVPLRRNAFHSLPTAPRLGNCVVQCDAVELVKSLPAESVDLVIFDPAYESLEKWRKMGSTTRLKESKGSSNKWFETFPNVRYWELFEELYRVLKKGTHLYMFCDEETRDLVTCGYSPQTQEYIPKSYSNSEALGDGGPLTQAGFKYWKSIIWDKMLAGMGYHYRARHEFIIMAEKVVAKGRHRRLNSAKHSDVLEVSADPTVHIEADDVLQCRMLKGKSYYPTEKPYDLIKILVEQSSNKDDLVVDPFCGSGVVGQVCKDLKRRWILGDLDIQEAARRLSI